MRTAILVVTLILLGSPLAGCLKKDAAPAANLEQQKANDILGTAGHQKLVDAAAIIPKNYSFPGQQLLPTQLFEYVGHITSADNGGIEAENDEGGIDYKTVTELQDISKLVPVGQPVELRIDLIWDASEVNSDDLDIAVDVPGTHTSYSSTSETLNWNLAVKTMVVDTIGVAGMPAKVGIEAASGAVTQGFDYKLKIHAQYTKDVLTPYHPWAFDVPASASGIVLESEKDGGDEHVTSQFIIIGPNDDLIQFVDFNDINIPTQSIFVPTKEPGTYVFYAYSMHGGFFRVKADVPLDRTTAHPLALVSTKVVDSTNPSPGVAGKDYLNGSAFANTTPHDDVSPVSVPFTTPGAFPLRVEGYINGTLTTQAKITLSTPLGDVHTLTKVARYEDGSGSIGYTSSHEGSQDNVYNWKNIQRTGWTAKIVDTSPGVEIGHTVLSYVRGS